MHHLKFSTNITIVIPPTNPQLMLLWANLYKCYWALRFLKCQILALYFNLILQHEYWCPKFSYFLYNPLKFVYESLVQSSLFIL